jgi:hypothetical protein
MKGLLPVEKREAVLQQELARLDLMQAAIYHNAQDGDIPSQEAVLKIMALRGRYLGLLDTSKGGGVHVNIGTGDAPNAMDTGIQIEFIRATKWGDGKLIEAKPIEHFGAPLNGSKG